jgi:5-methylcytosine-specific restriction endonuclease McrA
MHRATLGDPADTDEYARILRGDPCVYCGARASDIDHIDAISRGGAHAWDNLTAACHGCNVSKYSELLLALLLRTGQRPQTGQGVGPERE